MDATFATVLSERDSCACARETEIEPRKGDYLYATKKLNDRLYEKAAGEGKKDEYRWMKRVGRGNKGKCTGRFNDSVRSGDDT